MLELYQTEWCPSSRRVRERLTELCVDYLIHQVPVERERRRALREAAGTDVIPTLVLDDGTAVVGEDAITTYLEVRFTDSGESAAHRLKAAKVRRRYLEEECACSPPPTR
jgi:glutathione S-transferase